MCALHSRGEQESSLDAVIDMLQVISFDVYFLLDQGAILYFTTPFVATKFYILPNILNEPFTVATAVGDSVVAKRVYRNCPIMLLKLVTKLDLVEIDLVDFDVLLGMD